MDVAPDARNLGVEPYRPHRKLMLAAIVGIGWFMPWGLVIATLGKWIYGYGSGDSIMRLLRLRALVEVGNLAAFVGAILFLCWLDGAYRNLRALGSTKPEIAPGLPATPRAAVMSFLIPFVQFVRARRVMAHLWRESQPPAVLADGTVLVGRTRLVNAWYTIWLVHYIPRILVNVQFSRNMAVAAALFSWTAVILMGVMMSTIEKRQAEQFHDLELRQPAPPVTDQLR